MIQLQTTQQTNKHRPHKQITT